MLICGVNRYVVGFGELWTADGPIGCGNLPTLLGFQRVLMPDKPVWPRSDFFDETEENDDIVCMKIAKGTLHFCQVIFSNLEIYKFS